MSHRFITIKIKNSFYEMKVDVFLDPFKVRRERNSLISVWQKSISSNAILLQWGLVNFSPSRNSNSVPQEEISEGSSQSSEFDQVLYSVIWILLYSVENCEKRQIVNWICPIVDICHEIAPRNCHREHYIANSPAASSCVSLS